MEEEEAEEEEEEEEEDYLLVSGAEFHTVVGCTPISRYPLPRYLITHMNKSALPFYHTDADV